MKSSSVLFLVMVMLCPYYLIMFSKNVSDLSFFDSNNLEKNIGTNISKSRNSKEKTFKMTSSLLDGLAINTKEIPTATVSTTKTTTPPNNSIINSPSSAISPIITDKPATNEANALPVRLASELPRLSKKNNLALRTTLQKQQKFLGRKTRRNTYTIGSQRVTKSKLKQTASKLEQWLRIGGTDKYDFDQLFSVKKLKGRSGKIRFTGYYTPIIKARRNRTATYRYPLYKKPKNRKGKLPSRRQIDSQGALSHKGLELAWTNSLFDNYGIQLQGSGFIEYQETGETALLAYGGQNGHPFIGVNHYKSRHIPKSSLRTLASIEKWMEAHPKVLAPILNRNPSYTFFTKKGTYPTGSIGTALLGEHSIAVDPRHIPYGSCLLASVPVVNSRGKVLGHELRILLAQDKGGAIKGAAHVDLYCGVGEAAKKKAQVLNHYADVWILLAK